MKQAISTSKAALLRAIKVLGSQKGLAEVVGKAQGHVSHWLIADKGVPAEYCPPIERATREVAREKGDPSLIVLCEELRPDVPWDVLREVPSEQAA